MVNLLLDSFSMAWLLWSMVHSRH